MATEATVQVLDSAVEIAGVSTVTATRTVANPHNGTIYNPATFAAGVPVWFHRRQDGKYLALYSKRWLAATGVYHNGPALFSAHTEAGPCYAVIDPTTGTIEGPYNLGFDTLTSAVSRGDYLFLLGEVDGDPTVQHMVITRSSGLQSQGIEQVPLGYNLGLYIDGDYLRVFGADEDGNLVQARKNWGRIGTNNDAARQWEFGGARGWYVDSDETIPMPLISGQIPASGPVSVANFRDRFYLLVTEHVAGAYAARTYTTRAIDAAWKPLGTDVIPLGADAAYMGGGAYLQPHLVVNRALLPDGARTGFPYVISTKVTIGSDHGILTEWGILTV